MCLTIQPCPANKCVAVLIQQSKLQRTKGVPANDSKRCMRTPHVMFDYIQRKTYIDSCIYMHVLERGPAFFGRPRAPAAQKTSPALVYASFLLLYRYNIFSTQKQVPMMSKTASNCHIHIQKPEVTIDLVLKKNN